MFQDTHLTKESCISEIKENYLWRILGNLEQSSRDNDVKVWKFLKTIVTWSSGRYA